MKELNNSIITVFRKGGKPVGAGFLISENLAVTCAHVIPETNNSSQVLDEIEINFPFLDKGKRYHIQVQSRNELEDIAEIKILGTVPFDAVPVDFDKSSDLSHHRCKVCGFPEGHDGGVWAQAVVVDKLPNGWMQFEDTKQQGIQIQGGFSGAPVWDEDLKGVVGMVVAAKDDRTEKMAFFITAQTIMSALGLKDSNFTPPCPYKELFPFGEQDTDLFFGREDLTQELLEAVERRSFIPIVGASGSGKSSIVFAGLIPKLRMDPSWLILNLHPGNDPFAALASSIVSLLEPELTDIKQMEETKTLIKLMQEEDYSFSDTFNRIKKKNPSCKRILLFIDQLEELYTLVADPIQRNHFIDTFLNIINEQREYLTLLFTFRADFLSRALAYEPLATAIHKHPTFYLSPMKPDELRQAIEKPAETMNVRFEAGLTDLIMDQISKDPGALPLLEFALTQMWKHQENRILTLKSYNQIGGIWEALNKYADQALTILDPNQLKIAHRLFIQLVIPGVGIGDARRPAMRSEINETDNLIVEEFIKKRLLVTAQTPTGQETVEFVHDTLILGCKTFRDWIEKDREFLAWLAQLRSAMQLWKDNENKDIALLSGINLLNAEKWLENRPDDLNPEEGLFIRKSLELRSRIQIESERKRKLILAAAILSIITILIVMIASYISIKKQRDIVLSREIASQAEILSSTYPQQSLLLAIEAMNITSPSMPDAEQALRDASRKMSGLVLSGHSKPISQLVFSPDKHWLATGSLDNTTRLWDLTTSDPSSKPIVLQDHDAGIASLAFSPDGHWLATGSLDQTTRLYDLSGDLKNLSADSLMLLGHTNGVFALAFSPDKRWLATGSSDTTILIWDLNAKDISASSIPLTGPLNGITKLTFSPDGHWLAVLDGSNAVFLWDMTDLLANPIILKHPTGDILTFGFSPNSRWIVTAGDDAIIRIWSLKTGQTRLTDVQLLYGHQNEILTLAFSPDGHWLATGSLDSTVRLWDLTSNDIQASSRILSGYKDGINTLAFSPYGRWLVSGSLDGTSQLWDFTKLVNNAFTPIGPIVLHGNLGLIDVLTFSPDEHWMASIDSDSVALIWNLTTADFYENPVILRDINLTSLKFSPDGHWLGTTNTSLNVTAQLWNIDAKGAFADPNILTDNGGPGIIMSPRGDWFATYGEDETVRLLSPTNFKANPVILNHQTGLITALAFNSKGDLLASGASDNTTCLWNIPPSTSTVSLGLSRCFLGHTDRVNILSFSPDGHWLATGSYDHTVNIWDLTSNNLSNSPIVLEENNTVLSLSFDPTGHWLAVGLKDEPAAQLWNMAELSKPVLLPGNKNGVDYLAFSRDGHWLATVSALDGNVLLWDLTSRDPSLSPIILNGYNSLITFLSISPNSRWLAVTGLNSNIFLWDLTSGNPASNPIKLKSLSELNYTLSFSPDDHWLATGGGNNSIQLWDLTSKNLFKDPVALDGHTSLVTGLAFSPDSHWLISGAFDRTVRYWDMNVDEVIAMACKMAGRNLSHVEWSLYFSTPYHKTCHQWPDSN